MIAMTRTRWILAASAAVLALAAAGFVVLRLQPTPASASTSTVVKFDVGGQTCYDVSCAINSASVPWGQYVRLTAGWAQIKAVGQGTVMCKITDSNGHIVAGPHYATTPGTWAFCSFAA